MENYDIIGNWPGFYGGGMGLAVGADASMDPTAGAGLWPGFGPGMCGPAAALDPNLVAALAAGRWSAGLTWDCPNQGVDEFLGFECDVTVCAGDTVDIQATPQILFKPQRLIIPSTIAGQFVVRDLKVGNRPCFAGSGSIAGLAFAENSTYTKFNAETAHINQPITLTVTNISNADTPFYGTLIGKGVQPGNPRIIG